jgi:hypothetical protein
MHCTYVLQYDDKYSKKDEYKPEYKVSSQTGRKTVQTSVALTACCPVTAGAWTDLPLLLPSIQKYSATTAVSFVVALKQTLPPRPEH